MHGVKIKDCKIIETKDHDGNHNGRLIEIINILTPFMKGNPAIEQAYITVCDPGKTKGLHLHQKKEDRFCIIRGKATIALYTPTDLELVPLTDEKLQVIIIPPKIAHGIKCIGNKPCWILNCPSKAYNPKDPDQLEINMAW